MFNLQSVFNIKHYNTSSSLTLSGFDEILLTNTDDTLVDCFLILLIRLSILTSKDEIIIRHYSFIHSFIVHVINCIARETIIKVIAINNMIINSRFCPFLKLKTMISCMINYFGTTEKNDKWMNEWLNHHHSLILEKKVLVTRSSCKNICYLCQF